MRRFVLVSLAVLLALLAPRAARADEDTPPRGAWYGWQTLLADGAAVAMYAGGAASDHGGVGALAGTGMYLGGAPTIHALHGNGGSVGKSIALRLLAPVGGALAGGAIGYAMTSGCKGEYCGLGILVLGLGGAMVGMGVASLVDAFAWAHEPAPARTPHAASVTPTLSLAPGGGSMGVAGVF